MSLAVAQLEQQLAAIKAPAWVTEHRFAAELVGGPGKGLRARLAEAGLRDWRFDLAWPERKVAVEVDGGGWVGGRHGRGKGMESDREKWCTAVTNGWTLLAVTPTHIVQGKALAWVEKALGLNQAGSDLWRKFY